jgi:hypothetical protein
MNVGDLLEALEGIDKTTPIRITSSFHNHYGIEGVYFDGQGDVEIDVISIERNGE